MWRRQEGLEEGEGTPPGGTSITTGGTRATKTTSSRVAAYQLTTSGCRNGIICVQKRVQPF